MALNFTATLENKISPAAREATADLKALKGGLDEVSKALGKAANLTSKAKPPTGDENADPGASKKKDDGGTDAKEASKNLAAVKSQLAKAAGSVSLPVKLIAGAAGIAGLAGLTKMALGYAGVAKLEAASARLQMNFRSLFKGVDPAPLLRAFDKFSQNFSLTTVTGRALSDVLTKSFNGIFIVLEKFEPIATAAFQGMLIGALVAEEAILDLTIAYAPAIVAVENFIKSGDGLSLSAKAGGIAIAALAGSVVGAAAPFAALTAVVLAWNSAMEQATKLKAEWDSSSWQQIKTKFKQDVGITSAEDNEKAIQKKAEAAYNVSHAAAPVAPAAPALAPAANPDAAKSAGVGTGAALGAGIVVGMNSKAADVTAAGGALAKAADQGVRDAAQIKSPSKVMAEKGRYMGAGLEKGLDASKPGVDAAAQRSLVPDPKGSPNTGGGTVNSGDTHFHFDFSGLTSGNPQDIEGVVRRVMAEEMWKTTIQLGGAP